MNTNERDIWHFDYTRKRQEQAAQGWYSIGVVFGVNSIGFFIAWLLFLKSRSSRKSLYWMGSTDTNEYSYYLHYPKTLSRWQRFKAFLMKFDDVDSLHRQVGDEATFYLTFQRYALRLLFAMTIFAFIVLIPVYIYAAETPLKAFSTMTIRSVPDKSPLLWIPVASCYIFSLMYGVFLNRLSQLTNNRDPTKSNLLCMIPSDLSAKSILVTCVPKSMPQDRIFYLLDQIFPGYLSHVNVVYDLEQYRRLHRLRIMYENQLERIKLLQVMKNHNSVPWTLRMLPGNSQMPEFPCFQRHFDQQIVTLNNDISNLIVLEANAIENIVSNHHGTGRVFLVFNNSKWKARFVKKVKYHSIAPIIKCVPKQYHSILRSKIEELDLTQWQLELAPEPDDIDWESVSYQSTKRTLLTAVIYIFLTAFIILFTSPLAVTTALSTGSYSTTAKYVNDFVYAVQDLMEGLSPIMVNFIFSYVPTIILVMINAILLNVVYHAGRMQPTSTDSDKEKSILRYSAIYLIFNTLFVPSCTFVSINALFKYFLDKGQVLDILEMFFLSNSGVFFVNYVIQRSFVGTAVVMLRMSEAFEFAWYSSRAVTRKEKEKAITAWKFYTGTQSALQISVLVIIMSFSTVVPVILPFGMLYFFIQHLVDKYGLLYVRPKIKGKGTIAKTSAHASMFPLMIYQCAMSGFFLVRGTMYQNASVVVLLMLTFILILWSYIRDKERLHRAVGTAFPHEQTHFLTPTAVDLYRDPALRSIDTLETSHYGTLQL
ncbi:vacuolar protein sorting-associated protein [Thraustotheca clavata]|uniref:Vacuolar protein sorting-associated protein n=1 Tax=Thraustotheca clavata TaxID=74557 RepID=A0A1V9ZBT0_9STRA|nr:vacuolar protein sorting-associated protein [Thraustotheca clavata]